MPHETLPSSSSPQLGQGYRSILLATDFSPSADAAARQAVWAAKQFGAPVVLAHVLADFTKALFAASGEARHEAFYGDPDVLQREIRAQSDERLKQLLASLDRGQVDVRCETLVGEPFVKIIHAVQAEGYDLVVTGTRGVSAWKQFVFGSTAKRLVRMCPAAVWVVKAESAPPPKSILVATDFSDVSRRAVDQALRFAEKTGGELHVLHVVEVDLVPSALELSSSQPFRQALEDEANRRLQELLNSLPKTGVAIRPHLAWGTPWLEIVQAAQRLRADLLVLGAVGRSGIKGLLLGNTADRVLTMCDSSILTVKPAGFVSPIEPPILPLHPT